MKTCLLALGVCAAMTLRAQQPPELSLMPWPAHVARSAGSVPIDISFRVRVSGSGATDDRVQSAAARVFTRLARQTAIPVEQKSSVSREPATLEIEVDQPDHPAPQRLGDDEGYSLTVGAGQIRIAANRPLGAVRGVETFLQLVQQNQGEGPAGFSVPAVTIQDQPRFAWRGLSLDVCRHFMPLADVRRTITAMAAVKLNVLHWHLADDQGFRVESKRFPKLQGEGSDGHFYTQAQVRDLIAFARERGIRVVPEFDMPGHSASWLPGYPYLGSGQPPYAIYHGYDVSLAVLDPTQESTYTFLNGLIGEMAELFPDEYFHIGGDEVDPAQWKANARIQAFMRSHALPDEKALHAYFNQRVLKIVTHYGKHMVGWDEVLQPGLPKSAVIQSWRGQAALWQAARDGYQGILSAGYYLDLEYPASYHYSVDPMKAPAPPPSKATGETANGPSVEPGTPSGLSPAQARLILGGEAAMWVELVSPENLDGRIWPRLASIAERLWSPESQVDVQDMYRRLELTSRWLEWLGLTQRTNLELMRQRLAGEMPAGPLDAFATALEPVKGYARQAEKYNQSTPLNRLIDSIPAESNEARQFRDSVDTYLAMPAKKRSSEALQQQIARWATAALDVKPVLQRNSLLRENLVLADNLELLCRAAQEALVSLDGNGKSAAGWKQRTAAAVAPFVDKQQGDFLLAIAPGVANLVEAAQ